MTLGSASWRMSFGLLSPSSVLMYSACMEAMPPMPVPCVLATKAGWTQRISSAGVKPLERNASTVHTRFQTATRSIDSSISAGTPQTDGSKPVGIWPPMVRVSSIRRGTRISVPALRVTVHSPSSEEAITVRSGSAACMARASASLPTANVRSCSRNTDVSSGALLSTIEPSSP